MIHWQTTDCIPKETGTSNQFFPWEMCPVIFTSMCFSLYFSLCSSYTGKNKAVDVHFYILPNSCCFISILRWFIRIKVNKVNTVIGIILCVPYFQNTWFAHTCAYFILWLFDAYICVLCYVCCIVCVCCMHICRCEPQYVWMWVCVLMYTEARNRHEMSVFNFPLPLIFEIII